MLFNDNKYLSFQYENFIAKWQTDKKVVLFLTLNDFVSYVIVINNQNIYNKNYF